MCQTIVLILFFTFSDAHRYIDTQRLTHKHTHTHSHINQAIPGSQRREEIGSLSLWCRSAREKLLAAAKVERAYCLVMEKEWRSRHCTLSETLSNDSSVSPCTATVTQCLIMVGLCVCVHRCVRQGVVFVIERVTELMYSVIWHACLCVIVLVRVHVCVYACCFVDWHQLVVGAAVDRL